MTHIDRPDDVPVILPQPPKGYGFAPMPAAAKRGIVASIDASRKYIESLMLDARVERAMTPEGQMIIIWQVANPQRWAHYGCRTMFVDREMCGALKRTRARVTSGSLRGEDVPFRFPAFMVWWPQGTWCDTSNDLEIHQTIVSCYDAGDAPTAYLAHTVRQRDGTIGNEMQMRWPGDERGLCFTHCWTNGEASSGSICMAGDLASHFKAYSENHFEGTESITGNTPDSWDLTSEIAEVLINLLLLTGSYPEYIKPIMVKHRKAGSKKSCGQKRAYIMARTMDAKKRVIDAARGEPRTPGDPAYHVRPHERESHWRRQPHGDRWELDNPNRSTITMTDGRHAHMLWVEKLWVDALRDKEPAS